MKVIIHYEDNDDTSLHKSLKITLPKSWKTGPTSRLLAQFIESYNSNESFQSNPLQESSLHLCIRKPSPDNHTDLIALPSDAIIIERIEDRADVYVLHGPSQTIEEIREEQRLQKEQQKKERENTVACTHFGCKNRFPKGGPYPECRYHISPPVFHETAKFWSCCPNKKAYDWDDFQNIPGCHTGVCTDVKDENAQKFLGGTDLREKADGPKLKSIDDFNKEMTEMSSPSSSAAANLEALRNTLKEFDVENELFDQVIDGIKKQLPADISDEELSALVAADLGKKIKNAFKDIAVQQLRLS